MKRTGATAAAQYDVFIFPKSPLGMLLYTLARYYQSRHPSAHSMRQTTKARV